MIAVTLHLLHTFNINVVVAALIQWWRWWCQTHGTVCVLLANYGGGTNIILVVSVVVERQDFVCGFVSLVECAYVFLRFVSISIVIFVFVSALCGATQFAWIRLRVCR